MIKLIVSEKFVDLAARAFNQWGDEAQLFMLVEELAEVQQITIHKWRNNKNPTHEQITSEYADALIMLAQWIIELGIAPSELEQAITEKLNRLEDRLNAE